MTIQTCEFVTGSDLFEGLPDLWDEFFDSSPDFSWGNNNHTMVDPKALLGHLDKSGIENETQMETLRHRITELPDGVYVDLEN